MSITITPNNSLPTDYAKAIAKLDVALESGKPGQVEEAQKRVVGVVEASTKQSMKPSDLLQKVDAGENKRVLNKLQNTQKKLFTGIEKSFGPQGAKELKKILAQVGSEVDAGLHAKGRTESPRTVNQNPYSGNDLALKLHADLSRKIEEAPKTFDPTSYAEQVDTWGKEAADKGENENAAIYADFAESIRKAAKVTKNVANLATQMTSDHIKSAAGALMGIAPGEKEPLKSVSAKSILEFIDPAQGRVANKKNRAILQNAAEQWAEKNGIEGKPTQIRVQFSEAITTGIRGTSADLKARMKLETNALGDIAQQVTGHDFTEAQIDGFLKTNATKIQQNNDLDQKAKRNLAASIMKNMAQSMMLSRGARTDEELPPDIVAALTGEPLSKGAIPDANAPELSIAEFQAFSESEPFVNSLAGNQHISDKQKLQLAYAHTQGKEDAERIQEGELGKSPPGSTLRSICEDLKGAKQRLNSAIDSDLQEIQDLLDSGLPIEHVLLLVMAKFSDMEEKKLEFKMREHNAIEALERHNTRVKEYEREVSTYKERVGNFDEAVSAWEIAKTDYPSQLQTYDVKKKDYEAQYAEVVSHNEEVKAGAMDANGVPKRAKAMPKLPHEPIEPLRPKKPEPFEVNEYLSQGEIEAHKLGLSAQSTTAFMQEIQVHQQRYMQMMQVMSTLISQVKELVDGIINRMH